MPRSSTPIQVSENYTNLRLLVHWSDRESLSWSLVADSVRGRIRRARRIASGTCLRPPGEPSGPLAVEALERALEQAKIMLTGRAPAGAALPPR
jgi:hypothetical protein